MTDDLDKARRATDNEPIEPVNERRDFGGQRTGQWPDPDAVRAQPGDVVGIERGGETTELGDTAESEDERRREAQREARKP
jgi:hypothetical protein